MVIQNILWLAGCHEISHCMYIACHGTGNIPYMYDGCAMTLGLIDVCRLRPSRAGAFKYIWKLSLSGESCCCCSLILCFLLCINMSIFIIKRTDIHYHYACHGHCHAPFYLICRFGCASAFRWRVPSTKYAFTECCGVRFGSASNSSLISSDRLGMALKSFSMFMFLEALCGSAQMLGFWHRHTFL